MTSASHSGAVSSTTLVLSSSTTPRVTTSGLPSNLPSCRSTAITGTDNAVDEALVLVQHAAGLRPGAPESLFASRLTTPERRAAVNLIVRRIRERIPAPYLTGRAWFAGLELACDARALVPRSPIAEWIERGFEPWLEPDTVERVLEIGTGGGAIAVACALAFPNATVDAVDISGAALELARENCLAHDVDDRIRLVESDVYAEVSGNFDLIVSNPSLRRRRIDGGARSGVPPRAPNRSGCRRRRPRLRAPDSGRSDPSPPSRRCVGVRSGNVPSSARTRIPRGPVHVARTRARRGSACSCLEAAQLGEVERR